MCRQVSICLPFKCKSGTARLELAGVSACRRLDARGSTPEYCLSVAVLCLKQRNKFIGRSSQYIASEVYCFWYLVLYVQHISVCPIHFCMSHIFLYAQHISLCPTNFCLSHTFLYAPHTSVCPTHFCLPHTFLYAPHISTTLSFCLLFKILVNFVLTATVQIASPWSRVILEKLTVPLLVNKLPTFMEPDGSLQCLQQPVALPYTELDQSIPHPHPIS